MRAVASASDALPLRWLKLSVAASVTFTRSSGVAAQPLAAALVEDEAGELGALARLDRGDDLLGARHLRHRVVAHEAHRLDPRQPRRREPVDELGAHRRRERLRLVLEPVARADVADQRH